jgi:hypothetical protein
MHWSRKVPLLMLTWPFSAAAMSVDDTTLPDVVLIRVEAHDAAAGVSAELQRLLDDGQRTVLVGEPETLAALRPSFAHAWPVADTIVLDPASGLGVFGFHAPDDASRLEQLAAWPWSPPLRTASRSTRSTVGLTLLRQVHFSITGSSPSQVCRNFNAEMLAVVFGDQSPSIDEFRAFRREARRWCQYGNLSQHAAARHHFTIEPFRKTSLPRLSLAAEWALIRSEDPLDAERSSYLFWARTMGEGGGTGFTLRDGMQAWLDPVTHDIHHLMDVAIHSGWGTVDSPDVTTAWPLNSTFPQTGDIHVFRCDSPSFYTRRVCPASPMLRKLLPDDSFDGKITSSANHGFTYGGEAKLGVAADSMGKLGTTLTFGLQALRHSGRTVQGEMPFVQTRSNAGTVYYRSTWWTPNVPALYRWIEAQDARGLLGAATPLAATINPRHDIIWELPMLGNANRALPYHVVYEMGINQCRETFDCMGPDSRSHASSKARVGWMDGITVHVPAY